ncbi:MAG: outer membrane lipoprotein carrier protein LolA [Thermodesulfobacteriota bacterium]|nr:outer membrane lipoprotein carrier protein LolA [Thermodesulfobacteriota bacterium]
MNTILAANRLPFYVFLFFFLFSGSATALAESPEAVASRLQSRYDKIQSLSFDFIQDTRGQLSGRPKRGRGQAFFVKIPTASKTSDKIQSGKMRWNYSSPDRQVLVSDGKTFSMYFSSLEQMIITPAEALQQDLTYSFFTGSGILVEDFTILPPDQSSATTQDKTAVIKLVPKAKQSQVASIHLWVTDNSLIRRIEMLDHFDTLTVLNFSSLKVNTLDADDGALMEKLFNFTPPEGTEIIHQ